MSTYLEIVQKAIRKSGSKVDKPTTVVSSTGIVELFVEWVQDAWKDIQLEHLGWQWRVSRDETLTLVASTDEYAMPAGMENIDMRSVSIYENTDDESPVTYVPYLHWRNYLDKAYTAGIAEAKPQCFTITPDDKIAFYPPPDIVYTVRYDGHTTVEILDDTDAAGAGTSDALTPTGIRDEYHDGIMWRAVMYYAEHFEDGAKLQEAQNHFKPYKKYFEERELENVVVDTTAMYRRTY